MKIYLYHENKITIFNIPEVVSGSYSFDADEEEPSKLINIDAKEGNWVLYSTKDSKVLDNNSYVNETIIEKNKFYVITRGNNNYLIYVTESDEKNAKVYTYNEGLNLCIGMENITATYNCPYLNGLSVKIYNQNGQIILQHQKGNVYVNKKGIAGNYYIRMGDEISFCGTKMIFLNKLIVIYATDDILKISNSSGLILTTLSNTDKIQNIEIKDKVLYSEDDYFSKSPRIRRQIEEKQIELSQPPTNNNSQTEMPLILTMGPMATMGITSAMMMSTAITQVTSGKSDIKDALPSIITSSTMLLSTMLWPVLNNVYNKKTKKKKDKEISEKYGKYLDEKKTELESERKLQKEIIIENVIPVEQCLKNINNRKYNFWDKRIEQNDFLVARLGIGNELLKVKINYPPNGFSVDENELKKQVDQMKLDYKYIENVPVGYSFYENKVTAVMGESERSHYFVNNILLQLLTFYSYDELKIVIFTNEKKKQYWDYVKYLNHNMTNDSSFRFFASTEENADVVVEVLQQEISGRLQSLSEKNNEEMLFKPYYLVIVDDLDIVKKSNLLNELTEIRANIGFSLLILERKLSKLPSLCNNFINLGEKTSGILKNSYEQQEQIMFTDEINYRINMMEIAKILSNIPIDTSADDSNGFGDLPDAITFLEMAKVGKVEQLNILNRWNNNDSTANLKAEVGVDPDGKLMYLDLHEKAHGPHGLVAGMTGSGKSEFIITWILSLCMNFSPEDVAFILIDYKGGGLAFAFENQTTGVRLPHLTGTITNLDKAEINRTLVSIDSEVKRRQKVFNEARDKLGESTIDIYKYQGFYHDGKLDEPLPHLFIVCDEFAELKAQQPDFMDNLISVARIGRSLGVHLILATQKPSGVVNDQIWSNTKFRVCLKVQDASDSNEMLKRPDAASLKQTGRFYLQVGYDEYFALGQSGWCGAKYYPSDIIQKTVDKSVNVINETGVTIKNIQVGGNENKGKGEAQGEQLAAVMNEIIKVATESNKFAKRLWLENIPENITIENTEKKYNFVHNTEDYNIVIGEYDAPEKQQQYPLIYNILNSGNTNIVGTESQENEQLLSVILYNIMKNYTPEQVSFAIIDYGSQNFVKYQKAPHCAGVVTTGDAEKYNSLFKLLSEELRSRKKKLSSFGGEYREYVKQHPGDMPLLLVVFNNYESINESNQSLYENLGEYIRDSERYGMVYMISSSSVNAVPERFKQLMPYSLCLKVKDIMDVSTLFNTREKKEVKDLFGRGICMSEGLHEFQTASICEERVNDNKAVIELIEDLKNKNVERVIRIPTLPDQITLDEVQKKIKNNRLPIGINKTEIKTKFLDFRNALARVIIASKLKYSKNVVESLIEEIKYIEQYLVIIDTTEQLIDKKEKSDLYISANPDPEFEKIKELIEKSSQEPEKRVFIIINSLSKLKDKLEDQSLSENIFTDNKGKNNVSIIVVDEPKKLSNYTYDSWYSTIDTSEGLFVGVGADEQNILKVSNYTRELSQRVPINYGYFIAEGAADAIKLIEFEKAVDVDDDEE